MWIRVLGQSIRVLGQSICQITGMTRKRLQLRITTFLCWWLCYPIIPCFCTVDQHTRLLTDWRRDCMFNRWWQIDHQHNTYIYKRHLYPFTRLLQGGTLVTIRWSLTKKGRKSKVTDAKDWDCKYVRSGQNPVGALQSVYWWRSTVQRWKVSLWRHEALGKWQERYW